MGRAPCCDKANVKKGPWSPDEDAKLKDYIEKHGTGGNWIALPLKAGLKRCGKSCRLRWLNYLRPNIRHGDFTDDEDRIIYTLFASIGSRWSVIAAQLPGRTDNDIKNYWNTKLKKKILSGLNTQLNKKMLLLQQSSDTPSYPLKPSHDSLTAITLASMSPYSSAHDHSQIFPVVKSSSIYEEDHQPMLVNSSYYNTSALQAQDGDDHFTNSMHDNGYNITDHQVRKGCSSSNNLLMFRNEAAASSSSDGSCVTNHSKLGLQSSYFGNGVCHYVSDHHGYSSSEAAQGNALFSSDQQIGSFDYSIEEIKQLMSSGVSNNFNFFVDEYIIKTEEAILDK